MDKALFAHIEKQFPKFNERVCNGFAVGEMQHVERYIDRTLRDAEQSFPPGLRYRGFERCTPHEEYAFITAKRHNRQTYELASSDIYLVKYHFEYQGEELKPRYLFLPFVRDGGTITLLGSTFQISPVLADKAISVGIDNIFIPLNRDKLTFRRLVHPFMVDGCRTNAYVVWSAIYHAKRPSRNMPTQRKTIDVNASCVHYMFCKYGLTRTFVEFAKADVVVGMDDITPETYPPDVWRICSSVKLKPRGVKTKYYTGSEVKLAIRHEHYTPLTESLVAAFFYIADHFPDRVFPEYVDDTNQWIRLMGQVIFASRESEGKLANNVEAHMDSLDDYVDVMSREELHEEGIYVDDIYELFMYVVDNFSALVTTVGSSVASMYDKRLKVLRYVLIDLIKAIFNMTFALKKHSKKQLSKKEINDIMNKELKPELIIRMNRNHPEVSSISSPGDNRIFKMTSNVILQTNSTGNARSKKSATVEPSKFLHASIAEVGSFTNLPKSEPSGRSRINPYVHLGPNGAIERDPEKIEIIERTQNNIAR